MKPVVYYAAGIVLMLVVAFFGGSYYSEYQLDKAEDKAAYEDAIYQRGYNQGYNQSGVDTADAIFNRAVTCVNLPITKNDITLQLIARECLNR